MYSDRPLTKSELILLALSAMKTDGSLSSIANLLEIPLKEVIDIVNTLREKNLIDKDVRFDGVENWHASDFTKYFYKRSTDSFGAFIKPEYAKDGKLINNLLDGGLNRVIIKNVFDFVTVKENWVRVCRSLKINGFPSVGLVVAYWNSITPFLSDGFKPSVHETVTGKSAGPEVGW